MSKMDCGYAIDGALFADEICEHLLETSGLPKPWEPESLSAKVSDLAETVLRLAYINPDYDSLTETEVDGVEDFCFEVVGMARSMFSSSNEPTVAPYRVKSALERGVGNCVAFHEAVSGILKFAGLIQFCVGEWYGNHARTGLLVGNQRMYLDGYDNRVITYPEEPHDIRYMAWKNALDSGDVSILRIDENKNAVALETLESGSLCSLSVNESVAVVLPASSLVLMISAIAAHHSRSPNMEKAKSMLMPFAPML